MNVRAVAAAALALLLSAGAAFWLLADLAPDVSPGDPAFPATGGRRAPPKPAARDLGGLPYVGSGVGVPTPPVTGERGTPVPPDATAGIQPGKGMPRSESAPAEGEVLESARRQAEERERVAAAMKARDAERLAEARAGWIVVRGVVVDGDTGTGLGGIPLQAYPTGAESMQVSAATAVDGTFEVRGTFKGAWSLGAGQRDSSSEYGQTLLKRNGRPDGDLRVELRRGLALEGRIEDADGKAFAGNATVLCWFLDEKGKPIPETQKWVFTATGEFRLRGLDPGPHLVRASAHGPPGREAEGAVSAVVPSVEAGTKGLVVRLPKAAPIEGRLTDENGNPVTVPGRVRIRFSGAAGGLLRKDIETVVPGDGTFRSAALDPGTEYDLETSGFEGFEVLKKAGVAGGTTDVVLVLIRVE